MGNICYANILKLVDSTSSSNSGGVDGSNINTFTAKNDILSF